VSFWVVARTQPQREATALHFLGLQGFETYLPRILVAGPVRGRIIKRKAPLFPGYVFIFITMQWYAVSKTPGIVRLIMDGEKPAQLADTVVDQIRERESGGVVRLPSRSRFRRGQKVRIVRGVFEGHTGLYDGMVPHQRERILLSLLGQKDVPIEVPTADVEEAHDDV
jgi:transcriptional antiterminator RfaH